MDRAAGSLGRAFWRFWSATVLANIGDGIRLAAFPLLAASLTDSALAVAAVAAAQLVPTLVAGLVAGTIADRRGAGTVIVAADAARVSVLAVLVAVVALDRATIGFVVVCAVLLGLGETLRDTAAQTAVPRLVPAALLERANGRLVAGEVVGNEFVGPPVGAALFAAGAALPFTANGASLALAVMLVLSLPLSLARVSTAPADPAQSGTWAGLRWLAGHRVLRTLAVVVAAVAAADSAWFAIFVLYARDVLDAGTVAFGALLAVGAAGGLAGSLCADRLIATRRHRGVLAWSFAVTAGVPALLLLAPRLWAAVVVVVVTSASFAVLNVGAVSLRQRLVPEGLLGRVTAASRTLVFGGAAAGTLGGGVLASTLGLASPFVLSAVVAVLATAAWAVASRPAPPRPA
jgi:MFS family permease